MSVLAPIIERAELERARTLLGGLADPRSPQKEGAALLRPAAAGWCAAIIENMYFAGMNRRQAQLFAVRVACECLGAALLALALRNMLVLLLLPEVLLVEFGLLQHKMFKRAESFERDYTALLLSLASSVRTGLDPVMALGDLHRLFPKESELYGQLLQFKRHIDSGMSESTAIGAFAQDVQHPDLPLFRTAFLLSRREGASLGPCLERLARVTRQRQSFRRKARAAVAVQKLSALGIVGCCVLIAVIQFLAAPEGFIKAAQSPLGRRMMLGGVALLCCGTFWMLRITRVRL